MQSVPKILSYAVQVQDFRCRQIVTNGQVTVTGVLNCGGTFVVTNVGSHKLQLGDGFKLLHAAGYNGGDTGSGMASLGERP